MEDIKIDSPTSNRKRNPPKPNDLKFHGVIIKFMNNEFLL